MKIWIVGGKGLLGKTLTALCEEKCLDYCVSTRHEADITDNDSLFAYAEKHRPTHIVNCAAFTDVDDAEKNPALAYAVNAGGPAYLAVIAKMIKAKLIHISTDYVFDGALNHPYEEADTCLPLSTYGKSKWEGENFVLGLYPSSCIIRTSWLFGKGGKNFISSLVSWMQQKETLSVVSDQRGSPTFCKDLAQAILRLLNEEGIIHFANNGNPSRFEIAQKVLQSKAVPKLALKCKEIIPVSSKQYPQLAKRPAYSALNINKAEKLLGYPIRKWEDALEDFLNEGL